MTALPETKYLKVTFTREQRAEFALELARKTQHIVRSRLQKKVRSATRRLKAQTSRGKRRTSSRSLRASSTTAMTSAMSRSAG